MRYQAIRRRSGARPPYAVDLGVFGGPEPVRLEAEHHEQPGEAERREQPDGFEIVFRCHRPPQTPRLRAALR